jgi:hypothetical protein
MVMFTPANGFFLAFNTLPVTWVCVAATNPVNKAIKVSVSLSIFLIFS